MFCMRPVEGVLAVITTIFLLFVPLNLQQFVVFRLLNERWADRCLTVFNRGHDQRTEEIDMDKD